VTETQPDPETGDGGPGSPLGRVLVCIPTFNEADNLARVVARLRRAVPAAHLVIADDASPDGTGEIADRLAADDDSVHVLHRTGKHGLGAAYLAAFAWGLERGYGVLCEHDADGSHQPEQLPRLLSALAEADLVIGSRWVPGGGVTNWPLSRRLISRGGNLYARLVLGAPVRDITAGFRAFRRRTLLGIDLPEVASQGYCFQIDLAWRALKAGFVVREVPIDFIEREHGVSKMSHQIVAEALLRTTVWGLRDRARAAARVAHGVRRLDGHHKQIPSSRKKITSN
jgi:dolichol-phosphate mannosyltransferase